MIEGIHLRFPGDPPVDGLPAQGMRHPEIAVLRNMVMPIPELAADRGGER
jgi:hypothetical protein